MNNELDMRDASGCATSEPFALRVLGDSMSPEFEDGHIIIVDPGHPLVDGCFAIVDLQGEICFGRYQRNDDKEQLAYLNPNYQAHDLSPGYELKGVVTQRSTGRRRDLKHYDYPQATA